MCGRIALYSEPDFLARVFDAQLALGVDPDARPSWNIGPMRSVVGLAEVPDGSSPTSGDGVHRELGRYRWGLVPSWAKDPTMGNRTFNARAETVATKPSFRAAFAARRLAVVADGFYEWRPDPGATKQPYYFTRADGQPLALAGLWEQWWGGPDARHRRRGSGRHCAPARSSPPGPDPTWATSTTGCPSSSIPPCSTSGSIRRTGTGLNSNRCSSRPRGHAGPPGRRTRGRQRAQRRAGADRGARRGLNGCGPGRTRSSPTRPPPGSPRGGARPWARAVPGARSDPGRTGRGRILP